MAIITAELLTRVDITEVRENIRQSIDGITTFPAQAERPTIQVINIEQGVLWLIISGQLDERSLKNISSEVHKELLNLTDISKAELKGLREEEIAIEVDDDALLRYNITIGNIAEAIRTSSINQPLGIIRTSSGEILLRAENQAQFRPDFENIVVLASQDGGVVRLGDIAEVRDGFQETNWFLRYQGEKAAGIQVFRVGNQSIKDVAGAVHNYIEQKEPQLPEGIHLSVIADTSVPLMDQINMMIKNVVFGGLLVFVALSLFLRMRLAFWVVAGMPVCFLGAIWVMNFSYFDLSVNMLTLFGFILVIGIVVDDAIVIGESVHTIAERDGYTVSSTITGAKRVALPATFGVLTTIATFLPILLLPGVNGKLWGNIGWVVVFCLLFSLVESKLILPAHLAHLAPVRTTGGRRWLGVFQAHVDRGTELFIKRIYRPTLNLSLRWRYAVLSLFLAVSIITFGMIKGGFIRMVFSPEFESDTLEVELAMAGGTSFATTNGIAVGIEQAVKTVNEEIKEEYGVDEDMIRHLISFSGSETEVYFYAELVSAEKRSVSSTEIAAKWRKAVGPVPGANRLIFNGSEDDAGPAIELQLSGTTSDVLEDVSTELNSYLSGVQGVFDIRDSLEQGKQEMKISLLPGVEPIGLRLGDITTQLHHSLYGEHVQTLHRNGEEVKVYVRYPAHRRDSIGEIGSMHIKADNRYLLFDDIAATKMGAGQKKIERVDNKRIIVVTATVDSKIIEPRLIIEELQAVVIPNLVDKYPGLQLTLAGLQEGKSESIKALVKNSIFALFIIFALMAIPLGSYVQPLLIMSAIPFGIIGSLWGHWLLGLPVSVLSLCGIIALAGVVVNDSLVMVDFVNRKKKQTGSAVKAICEAGPARFRAILLTSFTTFIGLVPMMSEKSLQAQFLIPMAVSLAFGILFATVITLYLIPSLYLVGYDCKALISLLSRVTRNALQVVKL